MSWGSIFFFPKHEGYQAKIKSQPGKISTTPAAKVWDTFVEDNYLETYGSKQRPLVPTKLKTGRPTSTCSPAYKLKFVTMLSAGE